MVPEPAVNVRPVAVVKFHTSVLLFMLPPTVTDGPRVHVRVLELLLSIAAAVTLKPLEFHVPAVSVIDAALGAIAVTFKLSSCVNAPPAPLNTIAPRIFPAVVIVV